MKSEAQIQSDCVLWLWNTHLETRGLFFAITNNSENIGRAMQRKALGLVAGVADTCLIWRGKVYFIEFKTVSGCLSIRQNEWAMRVKMHGITYTVIRSLDEFKIFVGQVFGKGGS